MGFFKTFAIPSIARLLCATGEFRRDTVKRIEDTDLLTREFCENPLESARGEAALRRLNAIHGQYRISNSDYLYVLSVFVLEPSEWHEKFEWRAMHPNEIEARCNYWLAVGRGMGLKDMPADVASFRKYQLAYEKQHMRFHPANKQLADYTLTGLAHGLLPRRLARLFLPLLRTAILSLLPRRVVAALGFQQPHWMVGMLCRAILRTRGWVVRHLMLPRTVPYRRTPLSCPRAANASKGGEATMGMGGDVGVVEVEAEAAEARCPASWPYGRQHSAYRNGYSIQSLGPKGCPVGRLAHLGGGNTTGEEPKERRKELTSLGPPRWNFP